MTRTSLLIPAPRMLFDPGKTDSFLWLHTEHKTQKLFQFRRYFLLNDIDSSFDFIVENSGVVMLERKLGKYCGVQNYSQ